MLANGLILLGAAILVATLFHMVKIPPIVGFIAAGILVGPAGLGLIDNMPQVEGLTEIAAALLMFTIGLEFSLKELAQYRRTMLILGLGQIVLTICFFTLVFWLGFQMHIEKAIFISFLIAPSSTAVVFKLLYDHRDFETPYGKAAFSILLLQDIAFIPMIVMVPFLVKKGDMSSMSFSASFIPLLILIAVVVALMWALNKYALPFLFHRVSQTRPREIFFFTVLFVCMGAAAFMERIGLSVSLGAFVAGMLLAGSPYSKQAIAEVLPLRDTFLSLFFIAIGMMLNLNFLTQNFVAILLVGTLVIACKALILFILVWIAGSTASVSRAVTILLFQFGEFSFILAELGTKNGLLNEMESQFFIAIAIASLALTPLLYMKIPRILQNHFLQSAVPEKLRVKAEQWRLQVQRALSRPLDLEQMPSQAQISNHVIVIGYGVAGQSLCRVLQRLQLPFHVIEMNAETVRIYHDKIPITYGDASSPEILTQAGIQSARLVAIVTSGVNMLEPVLNAVLNLNSHVSILARTNYILDLRRLKQSPRTKFIVSELESTLEVIDETLRELEIGKPTVDELVKTLRDELRGLQLAPPSA